MTRVVVMRAIVWRHPIRVGGLGTPRGHVSWRGGRWLWRAVLLLVLLLLLQGVLIFFLLVQVPVVVPLFLQPPHVMTGPLQFLMKPLNLDGDERVWISWLCYDLLSYFTTPHFLAFRTYTDWYPEGGVLCIVYGHWFLKLLKQLGYNHFARTICYYFTTLIAF